MPGRELVCPGPLSGLTVLEFGHYYAGAMAGLLLAEQGASVIHICRPGEPEIRPEQYRLLHRGKRLLTLDLKSKRDRRTALELAGGADVVIENFRPGVMDRLGLGYRAVARRNARVVYLSLPGFASNDKHRAHIRAWEGILGAATGLYTDTHWLRRRLGYPPLYSWVPHCSAYGAMHGTIAVMAALVARESSERGTLIETPLASAGAAGFAFNFLAIGACPADLDSSLDACAFSEDDDPEIQLLKLSNAVWGSVTPTSRVYDCSDGKKILLWCVDGKFAWNMLKAIGIDQRVIRHGFVNEGLWDPHGADDNVTASYLLRPELKKWLSDKISDVMRTRSAQQWEDIFAESGLLATMVRTREEYLSLPAMLKSQVLVRMGSGDETIVVPGRIVDVSGPEGAPPQFLEEPRPIAVSDAEDLTRRTAARPVSNAVGHVGKGELLKGLRVLDLSDVLAGPVGAWILAEFGADVISALPPTYIHPLVLPQTLVANQGKRSILIDPATADGRDVLQKLICWSDVVMHNSLDESAERLGISHPQLQRIKPDVVSCQVSAFGGSLRGGWEGRKGFDPVVCMATGMMSHYGTEQHPQPHGSTSCGDVMGGLCAALATLLGVYQKKKTGYAGEARASLVRANNFIQMPYMIADKAGSSEWGEPHGQFTCGPSWHNRIYECSDGWIFVSATEQQKDDLVAVVSTRPDVKVGSLGVEFKSNSCSYFTSRLGELDISCHAVLNIADLQGRALRSDHDLSGEVSDSTSDAIVLRRHPCGREVTLMNPKQVLVGEGRSFKRLSPAPRMGQDTTSILQELGYTEGQVSRLVSIRAVHTHLQDIDDDARYFF